MIKKQLLIGSPFIKQKKKKKQLFPEAKCLFCLINNQNRQAKPAEKITHRDKDEGFFHAVTIFYRMF